jgi:hypothetical protein
MVTAKHPKDPETGNGTKNRFAISDIFDSSLSIAAHDNVSSEVLLGGDEPQPRDPDTGKGSK